jgi:hypothetical protein
MKLLTLAAAAALIAAAPAAHAANIITWAGPGTDTVSGVNNGAGSTTISSTDANVTVGSIAGGPATPFDAFLNLTATSIDAAQDLGGGSVLQHYSGSFTITSGAGGAGTNFLSGSFTDAALGAGAALTLSASEPPESVTFTSDTISAADLSLPRGIAFSFTNVTPDVSIDNGSIASFTASQSGTASAGGSVVETPEPASMALLGAGVLGLAALGRRRKN